MIKSIKSLLFANDDLCYICRESSNNKGDYICLDCYEKIEMEANKQEKHIEYIDESYYCGLLNKFNRELVTKFKFQDSSYLYRPIGEIMYEVFNSLDMEDVDLIIPVPIHRLKKAKRGFNQSELLAKYLSEKTHITMNKDILIKYKNTKAQSSLNLLDRMDNLKDSLMIKNEELILNKNIMIIDDILTTGSTISSCAKLLKLSGAKKVIGFTFVSAGN